MGRIRRNRGVTLLELVVTLAVVAILVAAAAPSFVDFFDRYRLRGAADDAMSLIANARTAAVKNNRDINIDFGGTTSNWCIGANAAVDPAAGQPFLTASACDCTVAAECQVDGQRLAVDQGKHEGVAVSTVAPSYTFNNKLGTVTSAGSIGAPAQVVFTSPSGKYDVALQVSALGQARVCVPANEPNMAGVSAC